MPTRDNINIYSEELQEVLGTPPGWLVRWGSAIAFGAFSLLLLAAYLVKYPDIIPANVTITAPNPPVELEAKSFGQIDKVFIKDGEEVEPGELILTFTSTAILADIDTLEKDLKYFSGQVSHNDLENFTPRVGLQIGELQEKYASFTKNHNVYIYGALSQNDKKSINRLQDQIRSVKRSIEFESKKRSDIIVRDTIAHRKYKRLQRLYSSDQERYGIELNDQAQLIKTIKNEYKDLESLIISKNREILDLEKDIAEVRQKRGEDDTNLRLEINRNIDDLKGMIVDWKSKYVLIAPKSGEVTFYQDFATGKQPVEEGTKILKIVPPGENGKLYGKVELPIRGSGKVEVGQEVVIKLDNYPYLEYGTILGVIRKKANVTQEGGNAYLVEVELPENLETTYGRKLNFVQGLQGTAEIITKERRFIFRIFEDALADSRNQ